MEKQMNFDEARDMIRMAISEEMTFAELRKLLPEWRKRPLQSMVFDVMAELGLKNVPFPGMINRPRLARKPIQISEEGNLNIADLLAEKGFSGQQCQAHAHVGDSKITLTVKPDSRMESQKINV